MLLFALPRALAAVLVLGVGALVGGLVDVGLVAGAGLVGGGLVVALGVAGLLFGLEGHGYMLSGAETPKTPSERAMVRLVATQSASRNDSSASGSAPTTRQSR